MFVPFWFNDINILLNKDYLFDFWPITNMSFETKLNAISRLVIVLSVIGFILTRNFNFFIIGGITLISIVILYKIRKTNIIKDLSKKESFTNNLETDSKTNSNDLYTTNPVTLENVLKTDYHPTSKKNPMGNVLLTDIMDNPERKAAAPSFNPDVNDDINHSVKKQTQYLNPGIINTNKQLYGDLKDNYDLDNSMRTFFSTANTRVTNDQGAFSKFLYGDMPSAKSSGPDGAFARVQDNARYILI